MRFWFFPSLGFSFEWIIFFFRSLIVFRASPGHWHRNAFPQPYNNSNVNLMWYCPSELERLSHCRWQVLATVPRSPCSSLLQCSWPVGPVGANQWQNVWDPKRKGMFLGHSIRHLWDPISGHPMAAALFTSCGCVSSSLPSPIAVCED